MEHFFLLWAACAVDASAINECSADTFPYWFTTIEECETFISDELETRLAVNGFTPEPLVAVCLGLSPPLVQGEPT